MIVDDVIVGGGVAGAVAATALAERGRVPVLLERSAGPHHKVCGEFLSWEACTALRGIGFDLAALAPARIDRVRLFADGRRAEARLPGPAAGVSRFALDEALLAHAARAGADIRRGAAVARAEARSGGFALAAADWDIEARRLYLATGKTNLRGVRRDSGRQRVVDRLVGFKSHYRLSPRGREALGAAVELYFGDWGYAGLQAIEGDDVNLCLLMQPRAFAAAGQAWPAALERIFAAAPELALRLAGAAPTFDRPLSVAGVPYGFLHDGRGDPPGLYRLGDQLGVVHSFTGDGMAMAAVAGIAAAKAGDSARFNAAMRRRLARPIRLSGLLQRLFAIAPARRALLAVSAGAPSLVRLAAAATRVPLSAL